MFKYALLCGSAPEGKIQKKIDIMYDSLLLENGGTYEENEIMIFPNGIDEQNLVSFLNQLCMSGVNQILLYICTVSQVFDCEKTVWLGGNEIRKAFLENPASLSGFINKKRNNSFLQESFSASDFSVQIIYDSDREFIEGSEYFLDEDCAKEFLAMGEGV